MPDKDTKFRTRLHTTVAFIARVPCGQAVKTQVLCDQSDTLPTAIKKEMVEAEEWEGAVQLGLDSMVIVCCKQTSCCCQW